MPRIALGLLLAVALAAPAQAELRVADVKRTDARLVEYTLHTEALAEDTHVRVLLPDGYDDSAPRRYPVLYLLHGCCDDYRSWVDKGEVREITAGQPLIVVMPDGGAGGFYSDWYNGGAGGPPAWETYHIGQLMPWVDATFRTVAAREGRAIAGLSMGGFGAMSYAARHPDRFVAAATFSGAVDTMDPGGEAADALVLEDGGRPADIWGPRPTEEVRWRAHNPTDLAENLRGLSLTVRTGNGLPGGDFGGGPDLLEIGVHQMSTTFHNRLVALGLPHVWDDYGPGAHQWPYWARDLRRTLPSMMAAFADPPPPPERVTFLAVESRYEAYGWRVALQRPVLEFSRLAGASRAGFSVTGSGSADVVTAPLYRPGARYDVAVGDAHATQVADGEGRLHVRVPLGAANTEQQYRPGAQTRATTTRVTVGALCARRREIDVRVPRGARSVRVLVEGRPAKVVRRPRGRVRVSLTGLPRATVRVRLVVRTARGRTVRIARRFRTCVPRS